MIQNLMFIIIFFENFGLGPHVPVDIIRVFYFIPDFLAESLKANKN